MMKRIMIMALGLALIAPSVRADNHYDRLRERYELEQDIYWQQWQADWSRRYDERHERHCKDRR
jgi:hypothetical protein